MSYKVDRAREGRTIGDNKAAAKAAKKSWAALKKHVAGIVPAFASCTGCANMSLRATDAKGVVTFYARTNNALEIEKAAAQLSNVLQSAAFLSLPAIDWEVSQDVERWACGEVFCYRVRVWF